jgi:di/tricarboxylate transporter
MPGSPLLLLLLLAFAILVFVTEWVTNDVAALSLLTLLMLLRYVTPQEAFSGFSSDAVIILATAFLFTDALNRSGLSQRIGRLLLHLSAGRQGALLGSILAASAVFSLVMNNIAAAAVLLPGVSAAARRRHMPASKVLMPLAFATHLGGMATLLTTSNIVVSELLKQSGLQPFGVADFLPVGGAVAAIGLAFLYVSPRFLPDSAKPEELLREGAPARSLESLYELERRLVSARVQAGSPLAGSTLKSSGLSQNLGAVVLAIVHADGRQRRAPGPDERLSVGDMLILDGVPPESEVMRDAGLEVIRVKRPTRYVSSDRVALVEAVLSPRSSYAGKTLKEINFREVHGGVSVLSIWRDGTLLESDLADVALEFGDALLLQGPRSAFAKLRTGGEIILLGQEEWRAEPSRHAAWSSTFAITLTLMLAILLPRLIAPVFFGGACLLLLLGSLSSREAYRAVDWKAVVVVAAMLPLGLALTRSGAAALLARWTVQLFHAQGAVPLFIAMTLLTTVLTQMLPGGAATPLIMAPVAISTAAHLGANPRAFAMAVALATGTSFLTPFSHPANLLVQGPGGYRFRDYVRLGLPLTLLTTLGILLFVPLWFSL